MKVHCTQKRSSDVLTVVLLCGKATNILVGGMKESALTASPGMILRNERCTALKAKVPAGIYNKSETLKQPPYIGNQVLQERKNTTPCTKNHKYCNFKAHTEPSTPGSCIPSHAHEPCTHPGVFHGRPSHTACWIPLRLINQNIPDNK